MFLFAGLMGMMALGATAFMGLAPGDDEDLAEAGEDQGDDTAETDMDAETNGTGILDFLEDGAGAPDPSQPSVAEDMGSQDADGSDLSEDARDASEELDTTGDIDVTISAVSPAGEGEVPERVDVGTPGDDVVDGTPARDVANGYDGDDAMTGGQGGDALWGGAGADSLSGDDGDDTLHGGAGNDLVQGGDGDDEIFGHGDDDALMGGVGDDSLLGGAGDDVLDGGAGDDAVHGGLGDDALRGGVGHDTLFGGWGDDTLSGFEDDPATEGWDDTDGMDYLNGGDGDDLFTAGADDIVTTGEGADTVLLGDWIDLEHQAQILDVSPEEDTIMVVYDDLADAPPEVDLVPDANDGGIQHVTLDGVPIASVNNAPGLNVSHITLVGASMLPPGAMP